MSATGLDVFDKTLQTTHIWLDQIMDDLSDELGEGSTRDRQCAWRALGAVLHALRDRMPVDQSAHLAAQLPLLVRGLYFDQWHPAGKPEAARSRDDFLARIGGELQGMGGVSPERAARSVFDTMATQVSDGLTAKVKSTLPKDIRALWPDGDAAAPL